jgi:hypothetical protein
VAREDVHDAVAPHHAVAEGHRAFVVRAVLVEDPVDEAVQLLRLALLVEVSAVRQEERLGLVLRDARHAGVDGALHDVVRQPPRHARGDRRDLRVRLAGRAEHRGVAIQARRDHELRLPHGLVLQEELAGRVDGARGLVLLQPPPRARHPVRVLLSRRRRAVDAEGAEVHQGVALRRLAQLDVIADAPAHRHSPGRPPWYP